MQPCAACILTTVLDQLAEQQRQTRRSQCKVHQLTALALALVMAATTGMLLRSDGVQAATQATTLAASDVSTVHGPSVPAAFQKLVGRAALQATALAVPVRRTAPTRVRRAHQFDAAAFEGVAGTLLEEGIASYYGEEFAGRPTANGEIFDPEGMTAAHPTLPMGSIIRVTHLRNGRQVVVRVNDRGPFAGDRILDLSRGAAETLGMRGKGTGRIRIEVL